METPGILRYSGRVTVSVGRGMPMDPNGKFPKEFREGFRALPVGVFSDHNSCRAPNAFETEGLYKTTKTFETTPARVPRSSR